MAITNAHLTESIRKKLGLLRNQSRVLIETLLEIIKQTFPLCGSRRHCNQSFRQIQSQGKNARKGRNLAAVFRAYRQAARTYPHHAPTYGRTGALYLSHAGSIPGAVDSAAVHLSRAVELNPHYAEPHTNLGTVLMLKGDLDRAREEFARAARLDTAAAAPLFNLGNLESRAGRGAEAETHYRAALDRDPAHFGSLVNLSAFLIAEGRADEARELLRAALRADPSSEETQALLADIDRETP